MSSYAPTPRGFHTQFLMMIEKCSVNQTAQRKESKKVWSDNTSPQTFKYTYKMVTETIIILKLHSIVEVQSINPQIFMILWNYRRA